jgi:myb proto-oncogene protein
MILMNVESKDFPPNEITSKPKLKNHFTPIEDVQIIEFVYHYGLSRIKELHLPNRSTRQIRERFTNYLDPNILKDNFTKEEDILLISYVEQFGKK